MSFGAEGNTRVGEASKRFPGGQGKPCLPGSNGTMRAMRDARIKKMQNEITYRNLGVGVNGLQQTRKGV